MRCRLGEGGVRLLADVCCLPFVQVLFAVFVGDDTQSTRCSTITLESKLSNRQCIRRGLMLTLLFLCRHLLHACLGLAWRFLGLVMVLAPAPVCPAGFGMLFTVIFVDTSKFPVHELEEFNMMRRFKTHRGSLAK